MPTESAITLTDPEAIATATRRIAVDELDRRLIGRSIDYEAWKKLNSRVQEIVNCEIEIAVRSRFAVWLPDTVAIASELAVAELFNQRALVLWIKVIKRVGGFGRRYPAFFRWKAKLAVQVAIGADKWLTKMRISNRRM